MNEKSSLYAFLRAAGAVLAGSVVVVLLSMAGDAIMYRTGGFPPRGEVATSGGFLFAAVYRTSFGVVGAFVTARLSFGRPMRDAMIYGTLGLIANTIGAIATYKIVPAIGPMWYPIALMATCLPSAWAGAKLSERRPAA